MMRQQLPQANHRLDRATAWAARRSMPATANLPPPLPLHRSIGNQAVQRLLHAGAIPSKLRIGQANDGYEQGAERVAAVAMNAQAPAQRSPSAAAQAPPRQTRVEQESVFRRRRAHSGGRDGGMAPPIVGDVLNSPGRALDRTTLDVFSLRFGYDFSNVHVHTGEKAAASARAVDALAYTVGRHIVLGAGYSPSPRGENGRLLAHELVHVMQWGNRPIPAQLSIGPAGGAAEHEAHAAQSGELANPTPTMSLQRAAFVCDEYRARPSGGARPGPGINVAFSGQRATVSANLQVHGAEADAAKAGTVQSTISSNWNGNFPDNYAISTTVNASYRAPGTSEDSNASQIELVRTGGRPTVVTRPWLVGSRRMALNLDESDALSWAVAHEFGHLLGLGDRYSESIVSRVSGLIFGGTRTATPDSGYENNIMGTSGGRMESRNVRDLIGRYTVHDCVRGHLESPL